MKKLDGREFCQVSELAPLAGKSPAATAKDLKIMIKKGMFLQGHLDEQGSCLMVTENAWEQYQAALRAKRERGGQGHRVGAADE